MSILFFFVSGFFGAAQAPSVEGHVYTGGLEAEAIYVPAGWAGPVVALPLDEAVF